VKSDPPPADAPRHLDIRKYPNRRYYDATRSRHLKLEDIRSLIREGWDVTVTDSKTGADITAQILTQIILELETPKLDVFPVPLLLRMIRFNDLWMKEFVDTHFRRAFEAFLAYQKHLEESARGFPSGIFPPFGTWPSSFFPGFGAPSGPGAAAGAAAEGARAPAEDPGKAEDLRKSVETLRRELEALQARLQSTRRGRGRKR